MLFLHFQKPETHAGGRVVSDLGRGLYARHPNDTQVKVERPTVAATSGDTL